MVDLTPEIINKREGKSSKHQYNGRPISIDLTEGTSWHCWRDARKENVSYQKSICLKEEYKRGTSMDRWIINLWRLMENHGRTKFHVRSVRPYTVAGFNMPQDWGWTYKQESCHKVDLTSDNGIQRGFCSVSLKDQIQIWSGTVGAHKICSSMILKECYYLKTRICPWKRIMIRFLQLWF